MKALIEVPAKDYRDTEAIPACDTIYSGSVSTSEQIVAVPDGADFVFIKSADQDLYVNYDRTVAVPTGSVSQAGGELINADEEVPVKRAITGVSNIHVIAASASALAVLMFYSK